MPGLTIQGATNRDVVVSAGSAHRLGEAHLKPQAEVVQPFNVGRDAVVHQDEVGVVGVQVVQLQVGSATQIGHTLGPHLLSVRKNKVIG